MRLGERLQDCKEAVVRRWLEDVLAEYSADAATAFVRQEDPFANPVGHSLRVGTRAIFDALLDGADVEEMRQPLEDIIRIRAVQELDPSRAVGFVFRLKDVIRDEIGQASSDPLVLAELAQLERRIDEAALAAFDVFVGCREQVCELRVNELKRQIPWIMERQSR
jgi:hypothetical protein